MAPSEIAKIHHALTASAGERGPAAEALGLTTEALAAKIVDCHELAALWSRGVKAPTVAEAYNREAAATTVEMDAPVDLGLPDGVTPKALEKSNLLYLQDDKLQKFDWEGVGIKDAKTLALMRQFETGVGRGVLRMMDAMQGGMAFCFAKVSRQLADVADSLETEMAKTYDDVGPEKRDDGRIMFLHARFMDLAREMQKFNKEAVNAAHTRLLIADRAKKIQQAGNRLRKPGWRRVETTVKAEGAPSG